MHFVLPGVLTVHNSSRVISEDISIHSGTGFAVFEMLGAGGHEFRRIKVTRRANPPYPLRLQTTNMDGACSCSRIVVFSHCHA